MIAKNGKKQKTREGGWSYGSLAFYLCLAATACVFHALQSPESFYLIDAEIRASGQPNPNPSGHSHNNLPHAVSTRSSPFSAPNSCGVVFFYHNGGTGGHSFNHYLKAYKDKGYPYYTMWGNKPAKRNVAQSFVDGVQPFIQDLTTTSPTGWKIIHSHHMNFGMNATAPFLQEWKHQVETIQKCKFLMVTIAREPLDHFLAKYRYRQPKNATNKQYSVEVKKMSHLEYFMYNWMRQEDVYDKSKPYVEVDNVTEKVRRAVEIVDQYYDLVVMDSNVTKAEYAVGAWTQWPKHPSIHSNSGKDSMFSKSDIRMIWKFLDASGDFEFYRQLKLRQASKEYPWVI